MSTGGGRDRGAGPAAPPGAGGCATQHRRAPGGRLGGVRHVGGRRPGTGGRDEGRCRRRDRLPPLPQAFRPRRGGLPSSGRRLRRRRPVLAAEHGPGEALARWQQLYTSFIATKRGLAAALHSGDPAFDALPAYFDQRFRPALGSLLEAAVEAGEVRADIEPGDLLRAVANLCLAGSDVGADHSRRMVDLLVDGLRYGVSPS